MDLFEGKEPLALNIPDGELRLFTDVDLGVDERSLFEELVEKTSWQARSIKLWGKSRLQPRLTAWYGDRGCRYTYSGISSEPAPWTDTLLALKRRVEVLAGHPFNSVLMNYYRDQKDSMGMHSDDEPELGPKPVIASLSLGQERTLLFKHKTRSDLPGIKLTLPDRSLLIMAGNTQRHWKHGIRKESRACGPRLNLTFRQIQLQPTRTAVAGSAGIPN